MQINVTITLPKTHAESEKDPTNHVKFPEDKIMLLMIAYCNQDEKMLEYLLNKLWYFWSISFINHLLKNENGILKPWNKAIEIVLRSKTVHTHFQNLSLKKRKKWVSDFIYDATTVNNAAWSSTVMKQRSQIYKNEFT